MKWFHHDTDMHRNRKIRKLIRVHGATGYAFWCVLLEKLYEHEQGFQIEADELWFEDIAEDLKLADYRTPIRILDTLAELKLIDAQLWAEHFIFAPSIAERGDQYIVKRVQEAEKKRRYREKKKSLSTLSTLSTVDKEGTKGQKAVLSPSDPDPDPDPDPDVYSPLPPKPNPEGKTNEHERRDERASQPSIPAKSSPPDPAPPVPSPPPRPVIDRQAAQFAPRPWRDALGKVAPEFQEFVGRVISFGDGEDMHPRAKGRAHIANLERSGDPYDREKLEGYWDDYQESVARPTVAERKSVSLEEVQRRIQAEMGGVS
jgi:hypothetical protein